MFRAVLAQKTEMEGKLGEPLVWMNSEGQRRQRAFVSIRADMDDRSDWPSQHRWLKEKLDRFHSVFAPLVRNLQTLDDAVAEAGV